MILLTDEVRQTLRTNAIIREMHAQREWPEPDPCPVVEFFNPLGSATWLATAAGRDGATLFGLDALVCGSQELGYISSSVLRAEIGRASLRERTGRYGWG